MSRVLIIDDDKGFCYTLSAVVQNEGHEAVCVHTLKEGLDRTSFEPVDVVYLDVMMPDGNGLDLLPKIKETASRPEVIISTSQGDPEGAELAIKSDAWDYVQKPSSILEMTLPRALQYRQEKQARTLTIALKREEIIGSRQRGERSFSMKWGSFPFLSRRHFFERFRNGAFVPLAARRNW